MTSDSLDSLVERINAFANARAWDQFHDPKNLSMALASEIGELCAIFRWVDQTDADSFATAHRDQIEQEIGDVGILVLRMCDRLKIDFRMAIAGKLDINELKYPLEQSHGRSDPPQLDK